MHKEVLKTRYHLLDEIRGFMVVCMVVFHGFYAVKMALPEARPFVNLLIDFFMPAEPFFSGGFILLSGLCCNFSRSNLKRGLILAVIAIGFNVATYIGEEYLEFSGLLIQFGILNLLAFCMVFVGVFDKLLKKVNPYVGIIINLIIFILTYIFILNDYDYIIVESKNLFMFGFIYRGFTAADYFPIIPWVFLYLVGYYLGKTCFIEKTKKILIKKCIIPFRFVGKYAIIVYILHQPIIFGATYLIGSFING